MAYKYFTKNHSIYTSKRINNNSLVMSIVLYVFMVLILYIAVNNNTVFSEDGWYWIIVFIGGTINLSQYIQRMEIDTRHKFVSSSYLGLFPKSIPFSEIADFSMTKHINIGFHAGTDIHIHNSNDKKITLLYRINSSKKVAQLFEEMQYIISQ